MIARLLCLLIFVASIPLAALAQEAEADLILLNGRVHTLEAGQPRAQAVAIAGERIVFVGSDQEARTLARATTRIVDLEGRPLYPGFTDSHAHLAGLAQSMLQVNLVGTESYEQIVAMAQERAEVLPSGEWILGRGWDQNDWSVTDFPTHQPLSGVTPEHPTVFTRIDGHALLANAAAMEAAGVDRDSQDPDGGLIVRDSEGQPTGVFVDAAMAMIRRAVPGTTPSALHRGLQLAISELHQNGITGVHDAGVGTATIMFFGELARKGEFDLRDYIMISADPMTLNRWLEEGPVEDLTGHGRITVRAIKMVGDGALGSRGAALLEDYSDELDNRGLIVTPTEQIQAVAERALKRGFQLCVHAIGDRANRNVLDAFEAAMQSVPTADHRFRVEHAQILHWDDIPRFAELGVIPSMQAQHQTSDMYWAVRRLGPTRTRGAYAWRSLLDTGVIIPGGSDFPVELPDPIAAYRAAVARQDAAGWPEGGWYPEQRMTRQEALAHLTLWPAQAAFAEDRLGSIRPGKLADLVVLSHDLTTVAVEDMGRVQVDMTVFDGKVVYERRP